MTRIALAVAGALLSGSPVVAQAATPVTQTRQVANIDPNRLICESEEQIGSRLGKHRVCLTAEQWKEKHREQREFTDTIQSGTYARDSAVQVQAPMLQGLGPQ
ncbi:MAG TPA: hypothetical protein VNS53_09980 [Sphingomicrobium sp.]|jgi:invasion protein IalB|nr:hypothetical protein [Sphingomicrobium sp.]